MIGKISTNIGCKQGSKVTGMAKYIHLQEVGTFQINYFGHKILTILHQNSENIFKSIPIMFLQKNLRKRGKVKICMKKGNVGQLLFTVYEALSPKSTFRHDCCKGIFS